MLYCTVYMIYNSWKRGLVLEHIKKCKITFLTFFNKHVVSIYNILLLLLIYTNTILLHNRWRAYDTNDGIEVAWNVVKLSRIPPTERKRIKTEVKLLKDIQHKNVIRYFNSWVNRDKEQIIFVTEIMSSGSLKE